MSMDQVVEDRLRKVEVQGAEILTLLRSLAEKVDDRTELSNQWRAKVDKILIGDGNGVKGHNVRLDRLEQAHDRSKWLTRSMMIIVATLALQALAALLGA